MSAEHRDLLGSGACVTLRYEKGHSNARKECLKSDFKEKEKTVLPLP